jgi:hypothetical protein
MRRTEQNRAVRQTQNARGPGAQITLGGEDEIQKSGLDYISGRDQRVGNTTRRDGTSERYAESEHETPSLQAH